MSIYNGHNEDSSGNILLSIGNGMTATLESGTTASQAYTKGSYVFFDNKLCKVTQDITSGTTLEIGTNLAQTSIGTELTSHLRSNDGKEFYFDVKDGSYGFYPSASKVAEEFVPFGGTTLDIPFVIGGAGQRDQIYLTFDITQYSFIKVTSDRLSTFQINGVAKSLNTDISLSEYSANTIQIFIKTEGFTTDSGVISFF